MDRSHRPRLSRNQLIIVAFTIPIVIAAVFAGILYSSPATILGPCYNKTSGNWRNFVIVANATTGYNNSRYQPFAMNVLQDECVSVSFINMDPGQVHGLAISHYNRGVQAQPQQTVSFFFQATQTGSFNVGEQILSTINGWTDNAGTLNVQFSVTFH